MPQLVRDGHQVHVGFCASVPTIFCKYDYYNKLMIIRYDGGNNKRTYADVGLTDNNGLRNTVEILEAMYQVLFWLQQELNKC